MRKFFVVLISLAATIPAFSQTTTPAKTNKFNLSNRAGDHFMLQISKDTWLGAADSVKDRIRGFSRGFNAYLMLDISFKGSPRLSAAVGLGVGSSSMVFKKTIVDITAQTEKLAFINLDTLNHFKKYKLATTYLELPVELRYTSNPATPGRTFKAAIGVKIGTLLNAHTKGKNFQNNAGATINSYTEKLTAKSYFNSTRLAGTVRVGYGYFSLFGAYSFTTLFKNNSAPDTNLLQLGLTISGL